MIKKKSLILGLFFAFAILFSFGSKPAENLSYAISPVQVTFSAPGATPSTTMQTTNSEGKLTNIPTPTLNGQVFVNWILFDGTPVTYDTVFETATTVTAQWARKINNYTISMPTSSTYEAVGQTETNGITYTLSSTSLENLFEQIDSEVLSEDVQVVFNFDDIVFDSIETINLPHKNVIISGSVSSSSTESVFSITSTHPSSTYVFENLTIDSASQNIIDASALPVGTTITVNNCEFNSTTTGSYVFDLAGTGVTFNLRGNNQTESYLFDYFEGLTFDVSEELENTSMLYATIDMDLDGTIASQVFDATNNDNFKFAPTTNSYLVGHFLNDNVYRVYTYVNLVINPNGGTKVENFEIPKYNYKSTTKILFPAEDKFTKAHASFDGWFGKITLTDAEKTLYSLSSNDWYFDKLSIKAFSEENFDLSKISNILTDDITTLEKDNQLTGYAFDPLGENENYLLAALAITLDRPISIDARWDEFEYTISFDSNGGTDVAPLVKHFGETIQAPTVPTKTGYKFVGWFDQKLQNKYNFETMPSVSFTLYAKWELDSFTVSFVSNNGTTIPSYTNLFGTEIPFPTNLTKTGEEITGWYLDSEFTNLFVSTKPFETKTVPGEDVTLYAKWEKKIYYIRFYTDPTGRTIVPIPHFYGDTITTPEYPTFDGYTFKGFFQADMQTPFVFDKMPATDVWVYEKWSLNSYKLKVNSNNGILPTETYVEYGAQIKVPAEPTRKGFLFDGWFSDAELQNPFNFNDPMPSSDVELFAKWTEKQQIVLVVLTQKFEQQKATSIEINTRIDKIKVEYFVGGKWTTAHPTAVGEYDIRLQRSEDNTYKEYSQVFKKAYVITPNTVNLDWLVYLLFAISIIELLGCIIIRRVRKTKQTQNLTFAIALPFGLLPTKQFVLIIVAGVLAIFGFVLVIYELVKLHKAVPSIDTNDGYSIKANVEKAQNAGNSRNVENNVDELLKKHGFVQEQQQSGTTFYDSTEETPLSNNASLIDEAESSYNSNKTNNEE